MSSAAAETTRDEDAHGHHPTARDYVRIAVVLAVLTALEVSVYFFEMPTGLIFWGLIVLAVAKFWLVITWYMHLKFDSRLYFRFFIFGIVLALVVFGILMVIQLLGEPGAIGGGAGGTAP